MILLEKNGSSIIVEKWSFWSWLLNKQHPQVEYKVFRHEWYNKGTSKKCDIMLALRLDTLIEEHDYKKEKDYANNRD